MHRIKVSKKAQTNMEQLIEMWNKTKLAGRIRNIKLTEKLTVIYLLFVLVPSILTVYVMNVNYYHILWEKYYQNAEGAYFSEVDNLEIRLSDIEKVTAYFTSNSVLLEYADTPDMTIAESVYEYLKYFVGAFQNARSSNQFVTSVTMYTQAWHPFEMKGILENLKTGSIPEEVYEKITGQWIVEQDGGDIILNYYQPVYTAGYVKFIGVLKVNVDPVLLMNCFTEEKLYFYSDDQQIRFVKSGDDIQILASLQNISKSKESRFSYISIKDSLVLNGTFMTEVIMQEDFLYSLLTVLLPSLLMLMLLPLIYQRFMHKQMKRISGLSEYISEIHTVDPDPYKEKWESNDEIGTLIQVYNRNIKEINRLLKEIDMAELQRKDSEFYALQAQIKPHFLYNTLENIRMTAEQERDFRTSTMLEILGSYMRYGLKKNLKFTLLTSELQHIRYYQQLMDIRFPEKIKLKISVYTDISEVTCPYLIFQPLIENAIKHGMEPDESIDIWVEIREASKERTQKDIEIKIRNNGYRIEEERLQELKEQLMTGISDSDGHVGLNNINFRLISCYGRDYYMRIDSGKNRGCLFTIFLPVKEPV